MLDMTDMTLRNKDRGIPGNGGQFAGSTHAAANNVSLMTSTAGSGRDANPSPYDVFRDDAPWVHPTNSWERYDRQKNGAVWAPRIWESLERADTAGDLGSTFRLDPHTGVVQQVHESRITSDYVQSENGAIDWPKDTDYRREFDSAENLYSNQWERHLGDLVKDLEPGDTLLIETQAVQEDYVRDEDGNPIADCTCDTDQHSHDNDDCDGTLTDDLVGWAMMARVERGAAAQQRAA
jgi:hypothetical protein